jgi:concanavalin A-like lectin/glucanase superfamily protein
MKNLSVSFTILVLSFCGLCSLTPPVQAYSPPTAGLVGWWSGNNNALDSSGNGHNGIIQPGISFAPGVFGQAFVTGSGRVSIPDGPAFELTSSLTIGAWMNMANNSFAVLYRGDDRPGLDPYGLSGNGGGLMGLQIVDATDAGVYLPTAIPLNEWVHVAGTLDGSTGDMKLYLNGVLVAQTTTAIRPFGPLLGPGVAIGNTATHEFPFSGLIDEVVLYNRALSPGEVMSLVPEPGSAALLGCGVAGFLWAKSRRPRRD